MKKVDNLNEFNNDKLLTLTITCLNEIIVKLNNKIKSQLMMINGYFLI